MSFDESVEVWQVGPPVVAGELTQEVARRRKRQEERCSAHVLGAIHLPTGAVERMRTWREGIDRQLHGASSAFWGYVVRPPMRPKIDQKTKRIRFWRFSCAGFVLACYRAGLGSKVVITKETRLPLVYLDVLRDAYGEVDERRRKEWGIGGNGPWRVLLAGYIVRAMGEPNLANRPYLPREVQEAYFPA